MPTEDKDCQDNKKFSTIILAAGAGKRMYARTPKILHAILGKPIVEFVVDIAEGIGSAEIILVVGKQKNEVTRIIGRRATYAVQPVPRGTGDATKIGLAHASYDSVLILSGDVPCITRETLGAMMAFHDRQRAALTVLTCIMSDPGRYGRIMRDRRGRFREIIEYSDATSAQIKIREINSGIYFGQRLEMKRAVASLSDRNKQAEYYLTDIVKHLITRKRTVAACAITDEDDIHGVNSRSDMARVRGVIKERWLKEMMQRGVYIEDPATTQIDLSVKIGKFVHIRPYTMLEGATVIANNAVVGPYEWIRNNKRMPLGGQKNRSGHRGS